jgi:hypothetical protein
VKKLLLAIVMVCPVAIWAQDIKPLDIKPGLWENTTSFLMSGMSMPANMPPISPEKLAQLPPAQRAQVEAMMKGGAGAPQTHTSKVCITHEQLSKPIFDTGQKGCSYNLTSSSSSSQVIHADCTIGNTKTAGDLTFKRVDSEHLTGDMLMKTTGDSSTNGSVGQNSTIKVSFSNKFLSSDCGDVKPANNDK